MDSKAEEEEEEEEEAEHSSTNIKIPILPFLLSSASATSAPPSPEPSSSAAAAVPFRWEEEPGKPKHSTAIVILNNTELSPKSLELPPRLLTPHTFTTSSNRFRSPSFRFSNSDRFGSFRAADRDRIPVRSVVRRIGVKRRWFGSWRMKKREVSGGSYVFPSSCGADHRETCDVDAIGGSGKNRVNTKSSALWRRIWEGLKQMGVWRSKTGKKDEYTLSLSL